MQALKFVRNVVATGISLLAIMAPAAKAKAQTQPATQVKNVLLVHGHGGRIELVEGDPAA